MDRRQQHRPSGAVTRHPSQDRFVTRAPGRETWHSFSFGAHYDPSNIGFGPLLAHNDDRVEPGAGYDEHVHRDVEIVTWVVSGALTHADDAGHVHVVRAGEAQALSAGSGVVHSERVAPDHPATRFVQVWLQPRRTGGRTAYSSTAEPSALDGSAGPDGWRVVASGVDPSAPLRIDVDATLLVGALGPGIGLTLPESCPAHVFVTTGRVRVGDLELEAGDALRCQTTDGLGTVTGDGEVLAWLW
jgi:redox-sensitive bicupin YhaK (pirin superfamily)